jgi:hypothetical protein
MRSAARPVALIVGQFWPWSGRPIGDGKPGPVTLDLIKRFHRLTRE